jgi:D-glycero-beta-D-manno-heptose-7-phosphate kinase
MRTAMTDFQVVPRYNFSRIRVLVVGDLLADEYVYGQTERVSREAPVLIVRHEWDEVKLGGAANAAANAASLGAKVTVIGVLGADAAGEALRHQFLDRGIAFSGIRSAHLRTEVRTRILAGGVSTTRQQMLRIDRGQTGSLAKKVREQLASKILRHAKAADVVLVSDYGAGVLHTETIEALRSCHALVCVDSRFQLTAFRGLSVLKPNEPEFKSLVNGPASTEDELKRGAQKALKDLGASALLVTRGRNGMALFQQNLPPIFIPVHGRDEAVDVTGAGDTVHAVLSIALGARLPLETAARLANVAGSIVVQKLGTATLHIDELNQELENENLR